ncbi:hypothetical protein [Candidatus Endomicrobiellum devescovinae]|jgi:hypothetical protein|uniref:hypothetical protein n=1 Tax=Candidatus Endomicrobiellum devescovinae TaxID=3242322 RepID=UPI00281704B7|nr:hypothetical protein [Endomicrobium sp.]
MNKYLIIFLFVVIAANGVFAQPALYDHGKDQQQQAQKPLLVEEEEEEEEEPEVPAAPVVAQPIAQDQNARVVEEVQTILQREGWVSWLFGHCSLL